MSKQQKISISGSAEPFLKTIIDQKKQHTVIYTNNSVLVSIDQREYIFSDSDLSLHELGFIGRAKKQIIQLAEQKQLPERSPIFYRIFPHKFTSYEYLTEIDLSSAYWIEAFRCGLLTDGIFKQGEQITKKSRLIAFGSAATVRRSFFFDGEKYTDMAEDFNEYGRRAYFYVASNIVSAIRSICEKIPGAVLLYWVDAIVCLPEYAPFVCREFSNLGYPFKTKGLRDCRHFQKNPPTGPKVWSVTEIDSGRKKEFTEHRKKKSILNLINANFEKVQ